MSDAPVRPPLSTAAWAPLLREALARDGRYRWPLRGTSMAPTLPAECEIEVVRAPEWVSLGSLLVFAVGDTLIAHRLVRRASGRWVTQGDGRLTPDAPLSSAQILGVVVAAYQGDRRCWPHRADAALRWFWVARYHVLRPIRFAWHVLRNLRGRS